MSTINDVWLAYREAHGSWSGCDWPTHYGSLGLDLQGVSSIQAHRAAGRWQSMATDEVAGSEITTSEKRSLVEMALHLRLVRRVVCLSPDGRLGVCESQAMRFCAEALATEWEFAARWLEEIETDARWAEEEAREAVRAAEDGDWPHALGHARQACLIQSGYNTPRAWARLKGMIERITR